MEQLRVSRQQRHMVGGRSPRPRRGDPLPRRAEALSGRHRRQRLPLGTPAPLGGLSAQEDRDEGPPSRWRLKSAAKKLGLDERTVPFVSRLSSCTRKPPAACCRIRQERSVRARWRETTATCRASPTCSWSRRAAGHQRTRLPRVVEAAGFALRREREVGSWRLAGLALDEADDWQDWPAEHRVTRERAGSASSPRRGRAPVADQPACGGWPSASTRSRHDFIIRASSLRRTSSRTSSGAGSSSRTTRTTSDSTSGSPQQRDAGPSRAGRHGQATRRGGSVRAQRWRCSSWTQPDCRRCPSATTSRRTRIGGWRVAVSLRVRGRGSGNSGQCATRIFGLLEPSGETTGQPTPTSPPKASGVPTRADPASTSSHWAH